MHWVITFLIVLTSLLPVPVTGHGAGEFRIAIDAGHTPQTRGAPSARNRSEYDFNRKTALVIMRELQKEPGVSAFLINAGEEEISLQERAAIINAAAPDLLISVHHDSVQPQYLSPWVWQGAPAQFCDKYRGYSIFISQKNGQPDSSRSFALALGTVMRKAGFLPSVHHAEMIKGEGRQPIDLQKGVYRFDNAVILREAKCAAVILECGIIRNRSEELLLRSRACRHRMARAVRAALEAVKSER
jgi:N-acetylmuramoyl-L-alanine amidase